MSAYNRGELSIDAYLVRILAALCRQNGGELRVKGELVDQIGEPTALIKEWDQKKQELVLRTGMGSFTEVYRVNPERRASEVIAPTRVVNGPAVLDPLASIFRDKPPVNGESEALPGNSTLDDERVAGIEKKRKLAQAMALIKDELRKRKQQPQAE